MLDQRRKVRDRLQRTDADEDDDGLGISLPGEIEPGRPSKRPDGDGGRNR
jgi:hypothetical protein